MMQTDTIKALGTYLAALILIIGGLWVIYATRSEASASEIRIVIAGFVGMALQFLFGSEQSTRASRSAERAFQAGVAVPSNGSTTVTNAESVTTGGPTTVESQKPT